jgi:hypothetical protein
MASHAVHLNDMTVTPPKSTSEIKGVKVVRPQSAPNLGGKQNMHMTV